ncbi:hypothetical protein M6B38_262030 [Iris pallida]|uniref:Secreted protein n=1 Tax=Iris pallida TaxID=29817 RepID=A0AAX6IDK5_IRIPA|nr:hypothetical protein M6B38_262030 [Iris pallida]
MFFVTLPLPCWVRSHGRPTSLIKITFLVLFRGRSHGNFFFSRVLPPPSVVVFFFDCSLCFHSNDAAINLSRTKQHLYSFDCSITCIYALRCT